MVSVDDILSLRDLPPLELFQRIAEMLDYTKFGDGPNDWVLDRVMPATTARPELLDPVIDGWRVAADSIIDHQNKVGAAQSAVEGTWTGEAASKFSTDYIPGLQRTLTEFHEGIKATAQTLEQVQSAIAKAKDDCNLALEDFGKGVFSTLGGSVAGIITGGITMASLVGALAGIWVAAALHIYDSLRARDAELDELREQLNQLKHRSDGVEIRTIPPLQPPKITGTSFSAIESFIPKDPPPEIARYIDEHS